MPSGSKSWIGKSITIHKSETIPHEAEGPSRDCQMVTIVAQSIFYTDLPVVRSRDKVSWIKCWRLDIQLRESRRYDKKE